MTLQRIFHAIALATLMTATSGSHAQVAKVNGVVIPQAHLDMVVQAQTARGQPDSPEMRDSIKNTLINQEVIAQEALKKGLQKNPAVAAQIALQRQEILVNAFVQDYLKAHPISDDTLKKEYERQRAAAGTKEYKARHILVEKEEEAKAIIVDLKKGRKFEDLAKQSKDQGSKDRGGDLDWNAPSNYVPQFADALVRLEKGKYTEAPVQTQFGWHVILVEDVRPATKFPPLEEVKPQITQHLQQQAFSKNVNDLRAKAKVE